MKNNKDLMNETIRKFLNTSAEIGAIFFGDNLKLKDKSLSPYFFNAGKFNTGGLAYLLGELQADMIVNNFSLKKQEEHSYSEEINLLVGPSYKGILLATATSMALWQKYQINMPFTFDRKEQPSHSEAKFVTNPAFNGKTITEIGKSIAYDLFNIINENQSDLVSGLINEYVFVAPAYESIPLALAGAIETSKMNLLSNDPGFAYNRLEPKTYGEGSAISSDWVGKNPLQHNEEEPRKRFVFTYAKNNRIISEEEKTRFKEMVSGGKELYLPITIEHELEEKNQGIEGTYSFVVEDVLTSGKTKAGITRDLDLKDSTVKGVGVLFDRQQVDLKGKNAKQEFEDNYHLKVYSAVEAVPAMYYLCQNGLELFVNGERKTLQGHTMAQFSLFMHKYGTEEAKDMIKKINESYVE